MSDQIAIEQGRQPWLPAGNAELVATLHHYDMPLVGVIRQAGYLYLFRCIEGHIEASNLWAYTRLDRNELASLRQTSPDDLDATLDHLSDGRPTILALSHEDNGVTFSALIPHPLAYPSLLHAAGEALHAASSEIDEKLARSVA